MRTLLYVDLLGVRDRWRRGGRAAAEAAFERFAVLVARAACEDDPSGVLAGGIESDSAALVCRSQHLGIRIARALYRTCFSSPSRKAENRLWMRGVLLPFDGVELRSDSRLEKPLQSICRHRYADGLAEAIAAEKAGFRGMRLLVHTDLVSDNLRASYRLSYPAGYFIPFKKLVHSHYPDGISGNYEDFLWMVHSDPDEWESTKRRMASRLRWSSRHEPEFVQAAATQLVFHECSAILASLLKRS